MLTIFPSLRTLFVRALWANRIHGAMFRQKWALVFSLAVILAGSIYAAGAIDRPPAPRSVSFDIPAQSLAAALQAFGQTTGVQVLYESSSADGRRSVAVQGVFAPEDALNVMLSATDLRVRFIGPEAITIALPSPDSELPPAIALGRADLSLGTLHARASATIDEGGQFQDYNEVLQTDIQKALRQNRLTRRGNYRAILDLWVDHARVIQRSEIREGTGNSERDVAVKSILQGLMISKPTPVNAPQPIRIVITVKASAT